MEVCRGSLHTALGFGGLPRLLGAVCCFAEGVLEVGALSGASLLGAVAIVGPGMAAELEVFAVEEVVLVGVVSDAGDPF